MMRPYFHKTVIAVCYNLFLQGAKLFDMEVVAEGYLD